MFLAVLFAASAARCQVIKLASLAPAGSSWDEGLKQIAAEWKKISNGSVTLKIYPGGIAGDEADVIRKMRIGQIQAAGLTGIGLCRIYKGVLAIQLPLLIRTDAELAYVLDKVKPVMEREIGAKGFTVLFWLPVGWVHFFAKAPVSSPDDLRKQKLFTWAGDPDGVQTWKEAGFTPVPLAITDMMSSLQSGMVEAFSATPLSAASYQWFGLAKNMCDMKWAPLIGGLVISTAAWESIGADLRPRLSEAAAKIGASLQQYGLSVQAVSNEDIAAWEKIAQEGIKKVSGKSFDQDSYDLVTRAVQEFRSSKK
jgi:TRAP-type C4-dicarboxylate transport system substrate-binding protein